MIQEKLGDNQEAAASYRQVLLLNPNETLALYNLGKIYEKLGEVDKAILNYEKLLEIQDKFDDAQERLERLKKQREENKENKKQNSEENRGRGQGAE